MYPAPDDHTGENIKNDILGTLEEWGLFKEKMVAMTTDNASNMVSACKKAGMLLTR